MTTSIMHSGIDVPPLEVLPWTDNLPKRKMCNGSMFTFGERNCKRCWNCLADWWSDVWHALTDEDRQWYVQQMELCGLWDGPINEDFRLGGAWLAFGPSLTRYQLH